MGRCSHRSTTSRTGRFVVTMAYQRMADVYDLFMPDKPYDLWTDFSVDMFERSPEKIQTVADLGCGTGEVTIRLAQTGYEMVGIDYSEEMLSIAQQKAGQKSLPIPWIHQDLRELEGFYGLDAAISYCDVINYITDPDELKNVFTRVAASLKDKGLFLFDVHSLDYVENHLINRTFADDTDEAAYIWYCIAGEERGEMYHELTFFIEHEGTYQRIDEMHHQRTFSVDFYKNLLIDAGFDDINVYVDFSTDDEKQIKDGERIFFIAEKRPEKI